MRSQEGIQWRGRYRECWWSWWACQGSAESGRWAASECAPRHRPTPGEGRTVQGSPEILLIWNFEMKKRKNDCSIWKCESFLLCWYCLSIFLQGVIWRNKTNIHYTSTIKGTATFATPFIFLLNSHGKKDKCEKFTHSPNSREGPTCFDFTSAQNFVGLC